MRDRAYQQFMTSILGAYVISLVTLFTFRDEAFSLTVQAICAALIYSVVMVIRNWRERPRPPWYAGLPVAAVIFSNHWLLPHPRLFIGLVCLALLVSLYLELNAPSETQ